MKLTRRPLIADRRPGYRVQRAWFPDRQAEEALKREQPDVALVQAGAPRPMAQALRAAGARTVGYLRHAAVHYLGASPADLQGLPHLANPPFFAAQVRASYGP